MPPVAEWTAQGAGPGDPVVYVKDRAGTLHTCLAKVERDREITVHGVPHEHVGDHQGAWVYAPAP